MFVAPKCLLLQHTSCDISTPGIIRSRMNYEGKGGHKRWSWIYALVVSASAGVP